MNRAVGCKPRFKGLRLSRYLKASAMAGATAAPASVLANFSGSYDVTPPPPGSYSGANAVGSFGTWNASLSGQMNVQRTLDTTGAPNQVSFGLSNFAAVGTSDYTFLTTAAAAGLVSFDYTASGTASAFFVDQTTMTSVLLTGSAAFSAPVTSGDVFGFKLETGYHTDVQLAISNFSAPERVAGVPDHASTLALLTFGFVGLLALRATVLPAN
jgi:hypothetical protein